VKRCPQCHRVETDGTLKFCRADGAVLVDDSSSFSDETGTARLGSGSVATEVDTSVLPHRTDAQVSRATGPTTALPPISTGNTGELNKRGPGKALIVAMVSVVVVAIAIGGYFVGGKLVAPGKDKAIESVAVLPFENKSGNADSEYLSDGLTESLIYRLSQLPGLKVSPTNAVLRYKGSQSDIEKIAKELDVDAVMSGRLTQRGDDMTISVELTNSRTNKLIWAEQYARKMSDLLATQREIATTVTQKLQLKLSGKETTGLTKRYTENNEAYQLYLKGRFFWNKRTPEGLKTAIEQFKAASEKDPNFALAYVGMADSYLVGLYNTRGKEKEAIPMAKAYATKALAIDPSLAEAHATMGLVSTYLWEWAEAERHFKRSIELNPNYPSARHWYSRLLRPQGRFDEAFDQIMQAKKADELSVSISNNVAENLFEKGDIQGSIEEARRGIEISPAWTAYRALANCYLRLDRKEDALANAKKSVELLNGAPALKVLGYVQAAIGNRSEALAIARELEAKFAKGEADGRDVAVVYAGLGENDKVFEWLEKDFQSHSSSIVELRSEVPFIPLRGDPRFKDLLKRMGLPE
jgi:adenylate cyclase